MRFFYVFLISLFIHSAIFASSCSSQGDGKWFTAGTWSCGFTPGCVDTIIIRAVDSVYIDDHVNLTACGPIVVLLNGVLEFKTGRKLTLADGSQVVIAAGASMIPGSGGGSSNYLQIGTNQVWSAADGTATGPLTYTSAGILPIKLVKFEANSNSDRIDLNWVTAVEINNDFFTIEKSSDLKTWEVISTIKGAGNSNINIEYFEVDYSPYFGVSYYRLKQTDFDGQFTYSNVIPVKFNKHSTVEMSLFPNPVVRGQELKIKFSDLIQNEVLIVMRDVKGEEFYSKVVLGYEDNALIAVPISKDIPSGVYLITASSDNQVYNQKVIIK